VTVIETHPEELLDRERDGSLTERERSLLMAHLRRCSACRMERQLRVDFERELAVSAQSLDLQMFVSDAIDAIEQFPAAAQSLAATRAPLAAGAESAAVPRGVALVARRRAWAALRPVAVLMLVCVALSAGVGIGAAQLGLAERAWQIVRETMDATFGEPPARQRARADVRRGAGGGSEAAAQPDRAATESAAQPAVKRLPRDVTVNPLPAAEPTPLVSAVEPEAPAEQAEAAQPEPQASAAADAAGDSSADAAAAHMANTGRGLPARLASAHEPIAASRPAAREELAARDEGEVRTPAVAAPPARSADVADSAPVAGAVASAARLFEEANVVRHQGHAIEASGLYRELQARFPNSAEARLSVALVARLQLDQGESAAALAGFETYLASSDMALREEATVGRVRALQRLERTEEARAAAQTLLELYPSSAFAPTARKLLEPPVP
jgi:tetratricopeptide (TPR) repeat protein